MYSGAAAPITRQERDWRLRVGPNSDSVIFGGLARYRLVSVVWRKIKSR